MEGVKMCINAIDFPSTPEISELCLMIEAKTITLSDVVIKVCQSRKYLKLLRY